MISISALQAHAINDNGWIAAIARNVSSGQLHAVVLVPYAPCPTDIAGCDGNVNVDDLLTVINNWGSCAAPCPPHCLADVNQTCTVDVDDLLAIINSWGTCMLPASGGAPMDVDSCYEKTLERYPDTTSQQFIDAFDRCIESLCIRGLLPDCD